MPEKENTGMTALSENELDAVTGGYNIVFSDDSLNRDSWFVSYVTRRMVQDSINTQLGTAQSGIPDEITVRGRRFALNRVGDQIIATAIS